MPIQNSDRNRQVPDGGSRGRRNGRPNAIPVRPLRDRISVVADNARRVRGSLSSLDVEYALRQLGFSQTVEFYYGPK